VQVENVESVAPIAQQHAIKLPLWAVRGAGRQHIRRTTEHDRGRRVASLMHHLELGDVVLRAAQPGQADIAGLVVALPQVHPPGAVPDHTEHKLVIGVQVLRR